MKKIALFLVMTMVLLHLQTSIFAQISEDIDEVKAKVADKTDEYSVEAETLFQLKIADKSFFSNPDAQIKRADFTMLAAALSGYKGEKVSYDPFLDINKEYYAAGSIAYLKKMGILSGYIDGTFRGEQPITYSEALIVLTKILGYGNHAKILEDGLSGYIKMAQKIDLDRGLHLSGDSFLTENEAFKLIYNALEIPVGSMTITDGMPTYLYSVDAKNAMNMWLGIDKVSGVVKNVGKASITWDTVGNGNMIVGNRRLFFADDANYYYALGKYCDVYFYNDSGDKADEVVAIIELPHKNDVTEIKTEDVISFKNGILKYQLEGKSSKNISINVNDDISLNGEPVSADKRENALLNSDGKIIINKIDESDINTVVMIESYLTCFVTAVDKEDKIIYGKFGKPFELDEYETVIIYDEYSELTSFENISVDDVLTIKSGADIIEIHICKQSESGVIESIKKDKNITYITLENEKYKLTTDQASNMNSVKVKDDVVAYFDVFGRIAYIMPPSGKLSYAYLYDIVPIRDGFEEEIHLGLYSVSGDFIQCGATKTLKIDEERATDINDIYTKLERGTEGNGFRQIVRYSLNAEGKINKIDTLYKGSGETDNSLHIMHRGYTESKETINSLTWKPRGGSFEGRVLYNPSTVKFLTVPKNYTGDKDYFFNNKIMVEDDKVTFNAYASTKEQLMPDVLLAYINTSSGTASESISETFRGLVTDIETQLNSDGDVEIKISFDTYGGEKNLIAHEKFDENRIMAFSTTESVKDAFTKFESSEIESTYKLERGDFAEITVDSLNRVIFARAIFKANTGTLVMDNTEGGSIYNHRFAFGFMHKNEGNVFSIALGDKSGQVLSEDLRYYNTGSARVYRVTEKRETTVEKISIDGVLDYSSANMGAEKVIVYTMAGITQIIVAYGE